MSWPELSTINSNRKKPLNEKMDELHDDLVDRLAQIMANSSNIHRGATAPSNTNQVWIDNNGVMKYYNGTAWVPTKATWG